MNGHRVLVTGIGGQPGFDTARRLLELGCAVVGVDADPHANGLHLPGVEGRVGPTAGHGSYTPWLLRTCQETQVRSLISTVESELPQLITIEDDLKQAGVATWLPSPGTALTCADKARFHQLVSAAGVPTPASWLPEQIEQVPEHTDLVVKPRRSQGSRDVIFCRGRRQAQAACLVVTDPIVQSRARGVEFTADCLVDRTGRISVILRERLLTKGGLAFVTRTIVDVHADAVVRAALGAVRATGLVCVQGFRAEHPAATPVLVTEINHRPAGAFLASEAAGADLIGQMLHGLIGDPVDHSQLTYRPGVTLTKFIDTLLVTGVDHAVPQ
ncbi:ATP-grasp domain-containing protein [Nocardia sp. NPDC050435]|uniref:ATP-grasp domain-containing protein n=1 Tax=Nocardia sp. NPDC050435 TaxID=3155040 RepID=UPI0033D76FE1